jgi:predicted nucleic acid-binding Zn ribbon protein
VRRQGPRPVSFALDALADTLEPPTLLARVQRLWPSVSGRFAGVSEPIREHRGVLTVACDSAPWASELDLMSEMVVAQLNARLGGSEIRRLKAQATRT